MMLPKTIVFIHGFMTTPLCWKNWTEYFTRKGYKSLAPAWPLHDKDPKYLRQNPNHEISKLTLKDVIDAYARVINSLDEKPIIIGHSLGGVITQKLMSDNYGAIGVCINSGPPRGIAVLDKNFILSNFRLINPLKGNSLCLMSARWYQKYVCNEMTYEQTEKFIEENCIGDSRNIARTVSKYGNINFTKPHNPLLFIAGSEDKSQPAALNLKNFNVYTDQESVKDFKEFNGRTHNIINQDKWEEVAEFIGNWLAKLAK